MRRPAPQRDKEKREMGVPAKNKADKTNRKKEGAEAQKKKNVEAEDSAA